jgi:hypothetical protein
MRTTQKTLGTIRTIGIDIGKDDLPLLKLRKPKKSWNCSAIQNFKEGHARSRTCAQGHQRASPSTASSGCVNDILKPSLGPGGTK